MSLGDPSPELSRWIEKKIIAFSPPTESAGIYDIKFLIQFQDGRSQSKYLITWILDMDTALSKKKKKLAVPQKWRDLHSQKAMQL